MANSLSISKVDLCIDVLQKTKEELYFVNSAYINSDELTSDLKEWISFYTDNSSALPIIELEDNVADGISATFTQYYLMLESSLDHLFETEDRETIKHWFDCSLAGSISRFDKFIDFAMATRALDKSKNNSTVYGRFDACINPKTGCVEGIYEFNGDTPVMLFESINLQNLISCSIGEPDSQQNDWWIDSIELMKQYNGKSVAVVCDLSFIEDAATCETISQMFNEAGATVYFSLLEDLNHDVLSIEKPFTVSGVSYPVDAVFILLPWEEMVESGHDILQFWEKWYMNVKFFEPAWRWFMSHKGMLAYVTYLLETDENFYRKWSHLPHLSTYLDDEVLTSFGFKYVTKPVIGRLSQNITIHSDDGEVEFGTDGNYEDESLVFQEYKKPYELEDQGNIIACGWISDKKCSTIAFRMFDGAILDLKNERFVAHHLI